MTNKPFTLKSMKIQTVNKTHTQKDGTVWEWTETPELRTYITQQQLVVKMENLNEPPKRAS